MAYFLVFWSNGVGAKDLVDFATTIDPVTLGSGATMSLEHQMRVASMAMYVSCSVKELGLRD